MGETLIDWADVVWNPITGCTKVGPGCDHCYAERMAKRLAGRAGYRQDDPFKVTFHDGDKLFLPVTWRSARRVFVNSMGDLFHSDVEDNWIDDVMDIIIHHPQHAFMVLTKRPWRMHEYFHRLYDGGWISAEDGYAKGHHEPIPNLWLGVTTENQEMADKRIPILLQVPAAVRFVSVEPMLGPVDLAQWLSVTPRDFYARQLVDGRIQSGYDRNKLSWVIVGGETGPGARPMHPDWVRSVRDQSQAAGVPLFFKSWGEWVSAGPYFGDGPDPIGRLGEVDGHPVQRVGKRAAGHLLDNREWRQFPEVSRS